LTVATFARFPLFSHNRKKAMEHQDRTQIWITLAAMVVLIAGLRAAESIVVPFLVSGFLAVITFPIVEWLTRRRIPVVVAVLLVLAAVVALLMGLGAVVGQAAQSFSRNLPGYEERLTERVAGLRTWLASTGWQIPSVDELVDISAVFGLTATLLSSLGNVLANVVMILLAYVFLLLEAKGMPAKLAAAFGAQSSTLNDLSGVAEKMKRYLALKAVISLSNGIAVWLFLTVIGIDYAVLWAMFAFLLNFIPNIGSVVAAIPPVLLALLQFGPVTAIVVIALYVGTDMFLGNVVEPRLMGKGLGLSPFVVFAALVFWGWTLGTVGMLLSVPLTILAQLVLASHPDTRPLAILLSANSEDAPEELGVPEVSPDGGETTAGAPTPSA
jgi:predicted PurR-regulated permease PerM